MKGNDEKDSGLSRRQFLERSAAGAASVGLSSMWLFNCGGGGSALKAKPSQAQATRDALLAPDVLEQAIKRLMAKGADFADVFVEQASSERFVSDDRKIDTETRLEAGVGLRAVKNGRTYYAFTSSFAPQDVFRTAEVVAAASAAAASASAPFVINLQEQSSRLVFPITPHPESVSVGDKVKLVKTLSERAWSADSRVKQVSMRFVENMRRITLASSNGQLINQTMGLTEMSMATYMQDQKGDLQAGSAGIGAYAGSDFFKGRYSLEAVVDKSVKRAKALMEATDCPRGKYPVVMGPGDTGVLFHESCGHGMEADLVFKGSNFKGQLGKKTAASSVTLVDDGTISHLPGSFAFDDEGVPSQRTVLIENGILKNYMCDKIWAQKLGMKSTGSGRRQSFRFPPIPRMCNTFIEEGVSDPKEIIAATKRGIYVAATGGGGQVDVVTGNFMMGIGEGFLIEDGKLTRPIKRGTLSGIGIEALKSIDMVANDLEVYPRSGRCGKFQTVPVGCGMPTIRVRGIMVGGKGPAWEDHA